MSGHSKWSKVKHQKSVTDAAKGKIFTKMAKAIHIAIREGGGVTDPMQNFRLRLAIEKARRANMPKENIERAIAKTVGSTQGVHIEEVVYEGFASGGVGIIIIAATDNRQRTISEIKNIFERNGGNLAHTGAVSHFFQNNGFLQVSKQNKTFDEIFEYSIDAGAIDVEDSGEEGIAIYTNPADLHKVKEELIQKQCKITDAELIYRPVTYIPLINNQSVEQLTRFVDILEDHEDVQKVFTNATTEK